MKARHAITLASIGWYLMMPPSQQKGSRIALPSDTPLSEWSIFQSFDSANECEQYRSNMVNSTFAAAKKGLKGYKGIDDQMLQRLLTVECVATDDPRLKAK